MYVHAHFLCSYFSIHATHIHIICPLPTKKQYGGEMVYHIEYHSTTHNNNQSKGNSASPHPPEKKLLKGGGKWVKAMGPHPPTSDQPLPHP